MKKYISLFFVFVLIFSAFGAFAQPAEIASVFSFRGVLHGILAEIKNEAPDASPAVRSPFSVEPPANEINSADNLSFAILGDTQYFKAGNPRGNFQKAVANISKKNPDLVIAVGDLKRGCKGKSEDVREYNEWKKTLGSLAGKTYAVQGNHERSPGGEDCDEIWQDLFAFPTNGPSGYSELAYSLDQKNSHFVFLNSEKPDENRINSTQRDWLEKDLAANKKENTFVIFHEPAYPVGDKQTEGLDAEPSERNALWEILDQHNVTAVFNGHEHIVSRRKIDSRVSSVAKNSVYQFVFGSTDSFNHHLPTAGVAEYANQGQGRYGFVKVNGKEIIVEVRDSSDKILNSFTFSK